MHAFQITFDEILHVHRNAASRSSPKHTVFSFMSQYQYTPYVTVPGFPRLEPGMRVTAVLRSENDWKTLVGWIDLDTNAIVTPNARWHLHRLLFLSAWAAFSVLVFGGNLAQAPSTYTWLLLLFIGFWGLFSVIEFRDWRRAKSDTAFLSELQRDNAA